jgi:hypothetical protein
MSETKIKRRSFIKGAIGAMLAPNVLKAEKPKETSGDRHIKAIAREFVSPIYRLEDLPKSDAKRLCNTVCTTSEAVYGVKITKFNPPSSDSPVEVIIPTRFYKEII